MDSLQKRFEEMYANTSHGDFMSRLSQAIEKSKANPEDVIVIDSIEDTLRNIHKLFERKETKRKARYIYSLLYVYKNFKLKGKM